MLPDITKKTEDKVRKTIEAQGLLTQNQHIVIGLSGGPDSVCLFHVLLAFQKAMNLVLHPVHVNHQFRPCAAEHDQRYVEQLCRQHDLSCHSFVVDCNKLAEKLHLTSEEAGRKARYDAFYEVAKQVSLELAEEAGAQTEEDMIKSRSRVKIAVAQNANDQAETVLFRLLRGTGIDGLSGIAYKRDERGFEVIRPLLDLYRSEIEAYCSDNRLHPVTDHTNQEAVYTRNKIRLELIPYLQTGYNENIEEGLVRLSRIAADDKAYLWQQADAAYQRLVVSEDGVFGTGNFADHIFADHTAGSGLENGRIAETGTDEGGLFSAVTMRREELSALHKALRHRVMLKAFRKIGLTQDISQERLSAADAIIEKKQAPKTVQFPHGYCVTVANGKVTFARRRQV